MQAQYTRTILIRFDNEIALDEIPRLRGAIIDAVGQSTEILYHNHIDDGFRYSYPLIQYKRINRKIALFCIADGVDAIGHFLANAPRYMTLGDKEVDLVMENVSTKRFMIRVWDSSFKYYIRKWLPLNSTNYLKYQALDSLTEKISFLENIMIGNILSFAKGIGINIPDHISCKFTSLEQSSLVKVKGVKMMAFDGELELNISLPDYIGVGKHASLGYGTIVRQYNHKK